MAAAVPVSLRARRRPWPDDILREKLAGQEGRMTPWLGAVGDRPAGGAVAR